MLLMGCTPGGFDSLLFHDDAGTFHVDIGNAWASPLGQIVDLGWDYICTVSV
jgi:hypothetical protein